MFFPNYLLSSFSVRRSWAEAHRSEVVRFLKAVLQARRWLEENKKAGAEFLSKELKMKPKLAQKGLDYYLTHRAWEPDLSIDLEGFEDSRRDLCGAGWFQGFHSESGKVRRS